ncbi:WYL domain-containing protein [Aliiglaciecola sp. LCG003]|uniref:WYL domain-containing protein n=1 Tax=Aliiglaciecola sp. LCG003 TaxID=3053655 RepID=UPI00257293E7|nr:WYL domain-containing protein [Aliiglaciecola sp. LCG003]WJG08564.1 WYL domain-containing protein [Aliiglaciecola sp. LCG003]
MADTLDDLNHAQRERLAFIDFSLQYFGHVARTDLIQRFQTGLAASTRDFSTYKSIAPDNLILRHQSKSYHRTAAFKPVFKHDPEVILTSLSRGFGNGISSGVQPSEQCFDAVRLIHPDANIIAALMRAIHTKQPIEVDYVSISSGQSSRVIVPHSIVNNGHRWHVRAYDRKHQSFRDFVCTRFIQITSLASDMHKGEGREHDSQWNQQVELVLVAHPSVLQPKAIHMDYAMVDGQLRLKIKAPLAAYLLRQWQVDCSVGHKFKAQGCQLALANIEVLDGLENTSLAPGYH